jgi:ABC-type multidrug transport system ATPase subunit
MDIINVKNLTKSFREITAVDDLSFSVKAGHIYGFLGQNGAGKSTTIRMLMSLVKPSSGEIEMMGMNLKKHRKEIMKKTGAVIERPDLYKYLTALENLRIFATMSGVKKTQSDLMAQLEKVGLADRAHSKVKTYSQGMKQRLGIATALVHDPQLIILDEPVNGLDPQGISDIRHLILHLSKDLEKTIFVSSHLLSEMEMIADDMLIIDKGKKVVEGNAASLLNPEKSTVQLVTDNPGAALNFIRSSPWNSFLSTVSSDVIELSMNKSQVPALAKDLVQNGIGIVNLSSLHTLEKYFLSITR